MILFMVLKKDGVVSQNEYFEIPQVYPTDEASKINETNVQLISWNQAKYNTSEIDNVVKLFNAVLMVALNDTVCKDINKQFLNLYGIDIFEQLKIYLQGVKSDYSILFQTIVDAWPHAMIGNIASSPGIRPQEYEEQYIKNWSSFKGQYMSETTKNKLFEMCRDPSTVGLEELSKSGRDQVRICRDWTELARAVMGEISTYVTKKFEKIYALELCNSQKLWDQQKILLSKIVKVNNFEVEIKTETKKYDSLEALFKAADNGTFKSIQKTEYIAFYFPKLLKLSSVNAQWAAFVKLINEAAGSKILEEITVEKNDNDTKIISDVIVEFKRFPNTMQCAMIINAIWKFATNERYNKNSITLIEEVKEESEYILKCKVDQSAPSDFIPVLKKEDIKQRGILLYSWMRDEQHAATKTYRHFLMPLWAGPSGHANGLLSFYNRYLNVSGYNTETIARTVLPSMFAFWRLYYDKRISGVHTLAETYEAIFFTLDLWDTATKTQKLSDFSARVNALSTLKTNSYDDAFETVLDIGIYNSISIMARIRTKYFDGNKKLIDNLVIINNRIDDLRGEITGNGFVVPLWSKPLVAETGTIAPVTPDTAFTGVTIARNSELKVRVFKKLTIKKQLRHLFTESTERLIEIYNDISNSQSYQFTSNDIYNPPKCLTDDGMVEFIGGMVFTNITDCKIDGSEITFNAKVRTEGECWKSITSFITGLDYELEIACMVSDYDNKLIFTGEIDIKSTLKLTDTLIISLNKLVIESGLDSDSDWTEVKILSSITDGEDVFDIIIMLPLYTNSIDIFGEFEDGKVLTINKLLKLFGLQDIIDADSILPDDESVFGSLGLRSVEMCFSINPTEIYKMNFVITAEKPWNILDDKITLEPYFEIDIENPFNKCSVFCTVLGIWHLGDSEFEVMLTSDLTIYAGIAENSVLNFADAAALFADGIVFPEIKFTDLSLIANFSTNDYSFSVAAEDIMSFYVGQAKLSIEGISFSIDFFSGRFGNLSLSGMFCFGGLNLSLNGMYYSDNSFSFIAEAFSDTDYSLIDFVHEVSSDLSSQFDDSSFPEDFLTVNIRSLYVSYESKDCYFTAAVDLDKILKVNDNFSIDELKLQISASNIKPVEFQICTYLSVVGNTITLMLAKKGLDFIIEGNAQLTNASVKNVLYSFYIDFESLPVYIREFEVKGIYIHLNLTKNEFIISVKTSAGTVKASILCGAKSKWSISYITDESVKVDMLEMPVVGELVKIVSPDITDYSVKDFEVDISSEIGLDLKCNALGTECIINVYKPPQQPQPQLLGSSGLSFSGTVVWIKINKTFSIITIPKIGLGMDKNEIVLLLDASLNVSPLTFSLYEAGVGVTLSEPIGIKFYLSGFGVCFDNGVISIGGSLSVTEKAGKSTYSGMLSFRFKNIGITAIGSYSKGSMMAYLALLAPLGGIPAFFVNGLSAGFGYNKKLILPPIEKVKDYPLITAAVNGFTPQTLDQLNTYMVDENGQCFLTAGLKFSTYGTINGFMLVTISLGKECELGFLGLGDLTIPPEVPVNPIAKAQLALKASLNPKLGVFSTEAQLTSESFILSKSCRLTGGFAAYLWFGNNEHCGDFVITLGGYHPSYKKPSHYPVVPRLGLNWKVDNFISIIGEIYFALTPSSIMAGGKLSATYTQGDLKAWFTAYADIVMNWKPFTYDISIGVSVGASYSVNTLLVHKTFSIELAADLHIWGPELHGRVHISWFIISFTIAFSEGADNSEASLDWHGFKKTFLTEDSTKSFLRTGSDEIKHSSDILTISLEGLVGKAKDDIDIISSENLCVSAISKIPESANIRPVKSAELKSKISINVVKDGKENVTSAFTKKDVTQNLPAAMWKTETDSSNKLNEESVVKDLVCGQELSIISKEPELFPQNKHISLKELYGENTLKFDNCFKFGKEFNFDLSDEGAIDRFKQNENEATAKRRKEFLINYGIVESVSITRFSNNSENWLSEDILIVNSKKE